MCENGFEFQKFCGICFEKPDNVIDYVTIESIMDIDKKIENFTYLDCFEIVTHIKIDVNVTDKFFLCPECRIELEKCFLFLKKAEESQKVYWELQQNTEFDNIIEEIVHDDETSSAPDLMDSMLSTNRFDMDAFDEVNCVILDSDLSAESNNKINITDEQQSPISPQIDDSKISSVGLILSQHGDTFSTPNGKEFSCSVCAKKYRTQALLNTHLRYHKRKIKSMQSDACKICEKTFSSPSYFRQHMELVHSNERQQFKCDECGKIYFTKASLQTHKRIHTGKTVSCSQCDKQFLTKHDLAVHLRFHIQNYPFLCKLCDKCFAIKSHLNLHMWREHKGLKLQCKKDGCGKLFTSNKALLEHSFVHADEMPYPCSYCSKTYPSKQKYKVHLFMVHKLEFDEVEDTKAFKRTKLLPRSRKFNLIKVGNILSEEPLDEIFLTSGVQ